HTRFSRDWSSDVCSSDLYSPTEKQTGNKNMDARRGQYFSGRSKKRMALSSVLCSHYNRVAAWRIVGTEMGRRGSGSGSSYSTKDCPANFRRSYCKGTTQNRQRSKIRKHLTCYCESVETASENTNRTAKDAWQKKRFYLHEHLGQHIGAKESESGF